MICRVCGQRRHQRLSGVCAPCQGRQKRAAAGSLAVTKYNGNFCTYCGVAADSLDHVVPHAMTGHARRVFSRRLCVPACRECNSSLLGSEAHLTVGARAQHVADRLRDRYAKLLAMPEWDAEELAGLERNMRDTVGASLARRRLVVDRVRYAEQVAALTPTTADVWSAIDENGRGLCL